MNKNYKIKKKTTTAAWMIANRAVLAISAAAFIPNIAMTAWAVDIQCAGNGAICEGTEGRDTIQGASTWDQILAHGGDDVVRGGGDGDSVKQQQQQQQQQ